MSRYDDLIAEIGPHRPVVKALQDERRASEPTALRRLDVQRMVREDPPPVPWVIEGWRAGRPASRSAPSRRRYDSMRFWLSSAVPVTSP